jgi:hypothetical protein
MWSVLGILNRFQDVFAKKSSTKNGVTVFASTHLICNVTDNAKCQAAIKWNVPIVRHEWILECFNSHQKLDIASFRAIRDDRTETKASMLMETPKANRVISVMAATGKQNEKFKLPMHLAMTPGVRNSLAPELNKSEANRNSRSSDIGIITPNTSTAESPFFKGMSRAGSRQLKTALDQLTSDSPSPDMSAMCVRLPRTSTPEGEAFRGLWNTFRKRFPGKTRTEKTENVVPSVATPQNPIVFVQQIPAAPTELRHEEVARQSHQANLTRKRPSDPDTSAEQQQNSDNANCGEERIIKKAKAISYM